MEKRAFLKNDSQSEILDFLPEQTFTNRRKLKNLRQ